MTYLDYIVFFEKRDLLQPKGFSGNATRLYLKLLHLANLIGWPDEFARADPYVAAACNLAINTMKECRAALVAGGLLSCATGGTGRSATATYRLTKPTKTEELPAVNPSKFDGFSAENPSNSDAFTPPESPNPSAIASNFDSFTPPQALNTSNNASNSDVFTPQKELNASTNTSNFDTLSIDKDKDKEVVEGAAHAASPPASLPVKKKGVGKKVRSVGATPEQIAALPLPFAGAEFAATWHAFYTTNPKQVGKALTAFELMLKKLGKYPEAFAVLMLERAIMGNWQGVENDGTARGLAEWQAEQARNPAPAPAASPLPTVAVPEANEEFLAQQAAAAAAKRQAHFAKYAPAA